MSPAGSTDVGGLYRSFLIRDGVAAGLAAGMRVIAITNTHPAHELRQATQVVSSYAEIERLLL